MKISLWILFLLFFPHISIAQHQHISSCSFYGEDPRVSPEKICNYNSFTSDNEAEKKIDDILLQVGLKRNFIVLPCPDIKNAMAVNVRSDLGQIRYILYDNQFLERINSTTNTDWAAISILAHEIGHHLNGHTLDGKGSRPDKELEADEFSGFVLMKLGASLEQAQITLKTLQSEEGSSTHPPRHQRLNAIKTGFENAAKLSGNSIPVRTANRNLYDLSGKWISSIKGSSNVKRTITMRLDVYNSELSVSKLSFSGGKLVEFKPNGENYVLTFTRKGDKYHLILKPNTSNKEFECLLIEPNGYSFKEASFKKL